MPRIVNEIAIRRPIADVFEVLTDVEQTRRWFAADVEEHWTSPPPHGVGSTRHAIVRVGGQVTENDAVATEFNPPRRAVMESAPASNPRFRLALDLVLQDGATRVTVTSDLDFRGLLGLVGGMVIPPYRRAWAEGLENLKRLMESGEL